MAGIKISDLPPVVAPALSDVFPIDQGATTYKESASQLLSLFQANGQPITEFDDTNVTLTLGGSPANALLNATSFTLGWTGELPVTRGGTGLAALTDHYVLVGNATADVTLIAPSATSGIPFISQGVAADPAYGTAVVAGGGTGATSFTAYSVICGGTVATGPLQNVVGVGNAGEQLTSNGAGLLPTWQAGTVSPLTTKGDLYTFTTVNARLPVGTINGQYLQVNSGAATGLAWSTATLPATALNAARILRSDGTNYVDTTSTFADTYAASGFLYANGANNIAGLATANNGLPVTGNTGVPSILAGPGTTGNILQSNAAAAPSFSTATYPSTAGSSGNVLTSDGTNILSSAPAASATSVIVDDTTTNATMYPTWVTASSGSLPLKVSSTKLSFNPSAGAMTLTGSLLAVQNVSSAAGVGILAFGTTPSAVNFMTVINNVTGSPPVFNSNGTDTNIGIGWQMKGTGTYQFFSSADTSAEIRLYEDTDDGASYIGLKAPAVPSSLTFMLPSTDGNLNYPLRTNGSGVLAFGQTPAFAAYASGATTLVASAFTKVLFATEDFDIGGYFASSTYTPLKAGIYQVNWLVSLTGTNVVTTSRYIAILYKNGAALKNGSEAQAIAAGPYASCSSHLVSMNGSTDTLEVYFYNANAATSVTSESGSAAATYFSAVWVGPLT